MKYTLNFTDLGKDDALVAGGKGASLGEMTRAGIPVPGGFVVLADTFDTFLRETDLVQEIETILDGVNHEAIHTVEAASESIQGLILSRPIPEVIQKEIQEKFADLGSQYVAVRSSATAEDGIEHAWAGQLDSYLNTTERDLIEKVRKCWASLFTPRAIFYRFEKELHSTKISVAVVVQSMVNSEKSGIAFSVHPVTEDYNQLIIEAGFGLGEAIVSGSVTPDSYVVEKSPRNILDINVSHQGRALYRVDGGGSEWKELTESFGSSQVLTEVQINELSDIILRIENHYGFPCDIEWAFEACPNTESGRDGKFFIVQSRPITTLAPRDTSADSVSSHDILPALLKPESYTHIGSYNTSPIGSYFWCAWYHEGLAKEIGLPAQFGGWLQFGGRHVFIHSVVHEIKHFLLKNISESDNDFFEKATFLSEHIFQDALAFTHELEISDETAFEDLERASEHAQKILFFWSFGWQLSQALDEFVQERAKECGISQSDLSAHLPHRVTPLTEQQDDARKLKNILVEQELWSEDVEQMKAGIASHEEIQRLCEDHLSRYAWILNIDWQSDDFTLDKLLDQLKHIEVRGQEVLMELEESSPFKKYEKALLCGSVNQLGSEYLSIFAHALRPLLDHLANKIDISFEDLKLLTLEEILAKRETLEELKTISKRRQNGNWCTYTKEDNTVGIIDDQLQIEVLTELFLTVENNTMVEKISGQVGNNGYARGRVRVILSAQEFAQFDEGDVLVTAMTTPDFILLMQKSAAIVTDMGGMLSHAAITARELGKPCVIGTKIATQALKDGDMVEVDADHGEVRILKDEPSGATVFPSVDGYTKFGRWVAPTIEVELWLDWSHTPEAAKLDVPYNPNPDVVSLDGHFFVRNTGAYPYIQERILEEFRLGKTGYADAILDIAQDLSEKCTERALQIGTHSTIKDLDRDFDLMRRLRFPWWACFALSDAADTMIEVYAKEQGLSIDDITAALPQLPSSLTRDQEALQSFRQEIESAGLPFDLVAIEKANPELVARLVSYQKQTEYLGTHHFWGEARLIPVFMDALQKAHAAEGHESVHAYTDIEHVLKAAGRGAQLRLECAQSGARLAYAWRPFLESLAEQVGLTYDEIIFLTLDEIKEAYTSKSVDISMVKDRAKKAGIYKTDDAVKVLWGQELEDHLEQFVPEETIVDVDELKGNIANKGKAQGRVVIVLTPKDAERVEKGTVLVAPETTPDFIPAMGRAVAFVTDRGGITSHAAIVAREMKKPCIIGTKIATQVLRDGDFIEVDADNGVVRILERNSSVSSEAQWEHYLTRSFTLFQTSLWHMWYTSSHAEEILGGRAYDAFYRQTGEQEVEHMRPVGQIATWKKNLVNLYENNPEQLASYLQQGFEYNECFVAEETTFHTLEEAVEFSRGMAIHATIVPLLVGEYILERETESSPLYQDVITLRSRSYYGDVFNQYIIPLAKKRLESQNVDVNLLPFVAYEELASITEQELLQRKRCHDEGKYFVYTCTKDVQVLQYDTYVSYKDAIQNQKELKGSVAFKGKVTGEVCIINTTAQIDKMKEGSILVSINTNPSLMSAIQKAGAIVTDEGGITCHAAIISRELKKPCVIGTKVATKVLKDGDLVEVDAETGVVRILEKQTTEKIIYTKTLERETSLLMQGIFVSVMENDLKEKFGIDPFIGPAYFYVINRQNVLFYEDQNATSRLIEQIRQISAQPEFLQKLEALYESSCPSILEFWKKKRAGNIEELEQYLSKSRNFILCVAIAFYGGLAEGIDKKAQELFLRIRSEYNFFANADEFVRDTLESFGVERGLVDTIAPSEIQSIPSNEDLRVRHENGAAYGKDKIKVFAHGQSIEDVFEEYIFESTQIMDAVDELNGQIAQGGKVSGVVRIVKNREDVNKVSEGEIIVSPMTTPDFLSAMKKASAFVTDEGGITCHAAIVAREMKKPCIIGTKVATQILKDGDLVEVDAEQGVVKIITRA